MGFIVQRAKNIPGKRSNLNRSEERNGYSLSNPDDRSGLHGQVEVLAPGHLAEIEDGIADATQGGVDTDTQFLGYFLEGEPLIEAHVDDLLLVEREVGHHGTDVLEALFLKHEGLDIGGGHAGVVEEIDGYPTLLVHELMTERGHDFLLVEGVVDEVVGYADKPGIEEACRIVTMGADAGDGTDEGLLEDIVGGILVVYKKDDVVV